MDISTEQIKIIRELRDETDKRAKEMFSNSLFNQKDIINILTRRICEYFSVSLTELKNSSNQVESVVCARYACFYLCNIYTNLSHRGIGKEYTMSLGSVTRGIRKIKDLNPKYKSDLILFHALNNMKTEIENKILTNIMPL